jgi:hypothetical protein
MIGLSDLRKPVFDSALSSMFEEYFALGVGIPMAIADTRDMAISRATIIFDVFNLFDVVSSKEAKSPTQKAR